MNTLNWSDITIDDDDLDLIYNRLLEKETPMTPLQLAEALIESHHLPVSLDEEAQAAANMEAPTPQPPAEDFASPELFG